MKKHGELWVQMLTNLAEGLGWSGKASLRKWHKAKARGLNRPELAKRVEAEVKRGEAHSPWHIAELL